ncbi:MAG: TetR/AcrR family transcriptional regulator [Myxococcales bacterium]|nr:MAG: TetR/AcrR family transcriptional regulator [Myxococcales bacterium]
MPRSSTRRTRPRRPGRPRQDDPRAAEVRQQLLDAATELALEHGFDACGLREIAARADVSTGMIAYYFGDRRGLYEAMFQRAFERVREQVETLLAAEETGGDRLDELLRIQVAALAEDPWLPQLILREVLAAPDPGVRDRFADRVGEGPLMLMIRWIEEEQARGVLRADLDPKLMAITLASLTAFPFLMLPILGERIGVKLDAAFPARLIEHNQKLLTHGIRARSEASG